MYELYCKYRDQKGYKDADVAKIAGVTKSTFSDWKSGRSKPNTEKLIKIANALDTSVEYLDEWGNEVVTCPDCGLTYNTKSEEEKNEHIREHAAWEKATKKFGQLYCNSVINEKIKAKNRMICRDLNNPLNQRIDAQLLVLRCLFSRSVSACDYNLNHVPFETYIAMMLGSKSYKRNLDKELYDALVSKYGSSPGINYGSVYEIPEKLNCEKKHEFKIDYEEMEYIKKYRSLDDYGRKHMNELLEWEVSRTKQLQEQANRITELTKPRGRIIQYFQRLASAGTGQLIFDDIPVDQIEIPDIPKYKRVAYAIGVNGNSMEPLYQDEDILLIESTYDIHEGEIGIFIVNGESFVKKLGHEELISLNEEYANIPLTEDSKCMGRVVDKLNL